MKLHVRFSVVLCVLIFASFANLARSQTTLWLPTSGTATYWDSGNWSDGVLPDINSVTYDDMFEFHQVAIIGTNSTAVVTTTAATANQLWVGKNTSTSYLSVEAGGILTLRSLVLGYDATSAGHVTITGSGSKITDATAAALSVGDAGTGSLTISNGGTLDLGLSTRVGRLTGSTGTVLVTGTDSLLDGHIGAGAGTAHITVTDHAIVSGGISGSNSNSGARTADFTVSNYAEVWGGFHGGVGSGTTTLTISNYASVNGYTGGADNSTGYSTNTVTVSANGILSDHINSGAHANSDITFNSGGTFTSGSIDLHTDGTATVTFDGGSHSLSTGVYVSGTGTNTLTLQNGAVLDGSGTEDDSILGQNSGEGGTVNLTNGSSWTTGGAIYVGNGGEGSLNVGGGSTVTAASLYVGHSGSGYGQVTVSGEGSELNVASAFTVGDSGTGSLTVSDYGHVKSAGDVTIANNGSSMGAITLASNGQLTIGEGASGHLYLNTEAGGHGSLNIGADAGSWAATAGTLNAASISGSANSVLVFNHTSEALFFNPVISGGVFVVHKAGNTILNGTNSYSGGNYISGGTLALGSTNALGTGDITLAGGTLDLNTFSQTAGTLTVSSSSYLDFSGTSALILADLAFTGLGWVEVLNFDHLDDSFQIGASLTGDQLARINIDGFIAQVDGSGFLSAGSTAFAAPVPEPSTYAVLAGLTALAAVIIRRRKSVAVVVRC